MEVFRVHAGHPVGGVPGHRPQESASLCLLRAEITKSVLLCPVFLSFLVGSGTRTWDLVLAKKVLQ